MSITVKLPIIVDDNTDFRMIETYKEYIEQNLKHLLLTSPGEKIMNIDFGVGLKNYLFENTNDQNISNIESRIISQVRKYMNFLEIIDVSVSRDSTLENNLKVNVFYYVDVLDLEASLEISV